MALSVSNIVKKWKTNAKQSAPSYIDGIRGTTVNPMQEAVKAIPRYLQSVQEAVSSGRMQARLEAVSPAQWKDACEKIGAPRISSGIDKGEAKYLAFQTEFKPQQDAIRDEVRSMPKSNLAERLQRMMVMAQKQAELRGRR